MQAFRDVSDLDVYEVVGCYVCDKMQVLVFES